MLAKLIVWAPTRAQAIEKLKKMLQSSVALGITTNQPFLLNCLSSPSFVDGSYTTALIPRHIDSLLAPTLAAFAPERQLETKLALVASVFLRHVKEDQETRNLASIPSDWSALNRQDLSRLPLEDFEIFLPNGTTTSLKLELPIPPATALVPFSTRGTTYNFRTWKNPPAIPADKSKGSGAAKAALVDNFYRGIASRDGAEGREVGDWKLGVGEDSIESVDVNVSAVRSFTEQRGGRTCELLVSRFSASADSRTGIHGYVRAGFRAPNGISVEETFFVATDDIGGSIGEAQTVFVHSREIASSIQVVSRLVNSHRSYADRVCAETTRSSHLCWTTRLASRWKRGRGGPVPFVDAVEDSRNRRRGWLHRFEGRSNPHYGVDEDGEYFSAPLDLVRR